MIELTLNISGRRDVREALEKVRVERVPKLLRQIAWRATLQAKKHATDLASNQALKRRTGSLVNHISRQFPDVDGQSASWGLPAGELQSRIGAFLETGGTVVPKVARMLRIPLDAAKTAVGVDRYAGRPLRTVPGFFMVKAGNKLFLARREDRRSGIRFWYVLKHRSVVPEHPWFKPAVDRTEGDMRGIIDRSITEVSQ